MYEPEKEEKVTKKMQNRVDVFRVDKSRWTGNGTRFLNTDGTTVIYLFRPMQKFEISANKKTS